MKKPRCGVPDVSEGGRFRRYVTGGKWSKTHLTYFVQPGQDLPQVSIEIMVNIEDKRYGHLYRPFDIIIFSVMII